MVKPRIGLLLRRRSPLLTLMIVAPDAVDERRHRTSWPPSRTSASRTSETAASGGPCEQGLQVESLPLPLLVIDADALGRHRLDVRNAKRRRGSEMHRRAGLRKHDTFRVTPPRVRHHTPGTPRWPGWQAARRPPHGPTPRSSPSPPERRAPRDKRDCGGRTRIFRRSAPAADRFASGYCPACAGTIREQR